MLYLSACRTSDSLQTQSQLHDVSDTEHTFRLAPVDRSQYENYSIIGDEKGDPNGIMRFEMCLRNASGRLIPQTCLNAFRNHRGEPIFFTIDAVSKAALTPEELGYVSGVERSWKSFRRDSKQYSRNKEKVLVIGGGLAAMATGASAWYNSAVISKFASELDSIDKALSETDQVLKKDFGVSEVVEVPGARKTLESKVSLRQIYDEDFLAIIARKAQPFLEAQNVDLNKALSVPKVYLDSINSPGVVEESLKEFMELVAPDQNISRIVKPQYQKHFLEYVFAKQYFIPGAQKLWVPLSGDATNRFGQMNEFFNKLVKQSLPISNTKLAPTSTTLHNVMEFVVDRGQLPQLSQEARLAIRAYQRGGLKALSNASDDVVDGLKLLSISGPPKKRLRVLYRNLFAARGIGLVGIGLGALGTGWVVGTHYESQKFRPNDDDNPDLVPKEDLRDLGIAPEDDTFTIMAAWGPSIFNNKQNVRVRNVELLVSHFARYLERIGFSRSDTSIAYVCRPKWSLLHDGSGGYHHRSCRPPRLD